MVNIRYLNKEGDTQQNLELIEAKTLIAEEIDKGNMIYNETEKQIIEKATMGKIKANANIAVFPRIAGG